MKTVRIGPKSNRLSFPTAYTYTQEQGAVGSRSVATERETIYRVANPLTPHRIGGPAVMSEAQYQDHPVSYWLKLLEGGDEPAQQDAVQALSGMGQAAVPELIKALKDDDWQVRNQAAVALGAIGPEAKAAVPALVEVLQDEDKYFRSHAATALGKIGREATAAIPALRKALKDKDEDVRRDAAAALGCLGPEAKAAVSDLVELLKDQRKAVRKQALKALEEIDPQAAAPHVHFWSRFRHWLG
jgi:hypothetical protein